MKIVRGYHAVLAVLTVLTFVTGELGLLHAWLGYLVAGVILLRVASAGSGATQLGLRRFYPEFAGLRLDNALGHPAISRTILASLAVCLILASASGVALDRGAAIGMASIVGPAIADEHPRRTGRAETKRGGLAGLLGDGHEAIGNLVLPIVLVHVGYLALFKWPLARFMLFRPLAKRPAG